VLDHDDGDPGGVGRLDRLGDARDRLAVGRMLDRQRAAAEVVLLDVDEDECALRAGHGGLLGDSGGRGDATGDGCSSILGRPVRNHQWRKGRHTMRSRQA
jgi:hypothetical protein